MCYTVKGESSLESLRLRPLALKRTLIALGVNSVEFFSLTIVIKKNTRVKTGLLGEKKRYNVLTHKR